MPDAAAVPAGPLRIRAFDRERDAGAVRALDVSLVSGHAFEVRVEQDALHLHAVPAPPAVKHFPLDLDADAWEEGWVAVEGEAVRGFVATSFEAWNRRLTLWHFYVDAAHRGAGTGRRLMEHAIGRGRARGALTAWAETSNRNYPGVQSYRRLGFELCGFDLSLYRGTPAEGEFALFLSRPIYPGEPSADLPSTSPGADRVDG
jgi:ribosomal protein S18 acetylase RimI-like enzyme